MIQDQDDADYEERRMPDFDVEENDGSDEDQIDEVIGLLDVNNFDQIRIGLASPEMIRAWSSGEVKPETINYRTLKLTRRPVL